MSNYKGKKNQNQQTFLEVLLIGIFQVLWWLVTLPFKGVSKSKKSRFSLEDRNYITSKRLEIETMSNSANEIELKHAVMEADKLVDYALKAQGYGGETFAERLQNAEKYIDARVYQEIWQGHKVRNQIAHESDSRVSIYELGEAARKLLNYTKTI